MAIAYLNIGSNLGDSRSLIFKAIEIIGDKFSPYCLSRMVESEPWGYESANRFLNIGMAFKCELEPEELLFFVKGIEKEISSGSHRNENGGYCDREIDIDIMAIDHIQYLSPTLQVPHPHLMERDFFILPLMELNPEWMKV